VYSREIDGQTITITPSGWTYKRTFVLVDRETGSLWYPKEGGLMGIQGTHFKKWLPELQSTDTRWSKWKQTHPSTKLMK
jgi:hypothetical protein